MVGTKRPSEDSNEQPITKKPKLGESPVQMDEVPQHPTQSKRPREESSSPDEERATKKKKIEEEQSETAEKISQKQQLGKRSRETDFDDGSQGKKTKTSHEQPKGKRNRHHNAQGKYKQAAKSQPPTEPKKVLGPHHRSAKAKPRLRFLHQLPAEVRAMIFKDCVSWNGRAHPLVRALRCSKLLYPEIMEHFHKADNTFHLNKRNGWSFCNMGEAALESVRKLKVEIMEYRANPKRPREFLTVPKPRKISKLYARLTNLRTITLEGNLGPVSPAIFAQIHEYIRNATKIESLDVDFRFLNMSPIHSINARRAISELNERLGVEGKENVTERLRRAQRSGVLSCVWFWEMEKKGEFLKMVRRRNKDGEEVDDTTATT